MKRIIWIILSWLVLLTTAEAASFDCAKAATKIEKMICGDQELTDLDSRMGKIYIDALGVYTYSSKLKVTADQKEWISHTRNQCKDEACLKSAYLSRIEKLNEPFAPRPYRVPDTILPDAKVNTFSGIVGLINNSNERTDSFNADIKKLKINGVITQCKMLIDISLGTAHGNHSYGGICTLLADQSNSDVMICDDLMVGHFKMTKISKKVTNQDLADFVMSNCYGG